jgi:hypothetical protein
MQKRTRASIIYALSKADIGSNVCFILIIAKCIKSTKPSIGCGRSFEGFAQVALINLLS